MMRRCPKYFETFSIWWSFGSRIFMQWSNANEPSQVDLSSEKVFADEEGSNTFTEAGNEKQGSSSSVTPGGQVEKKKAGNSNQVEITPICISEERKTKV